MIKLKESTQQLLALLTIESLALLLILSIPSTENYMGVGYSYYTHAQKVFVTLIFLFMVGLTALGTILDYRKPVNADVKNKK